MKASKKNMTVNNSCVFEFFKRYCSGGVSEVQNRFPRLRTIAMVQNLDSILDDAKVVDQSFTSVEEGMQTWIELNKSLVESNGGLVVKYSFKNVLRYNDQFITRKGLWKLDSLLADRFDSMKQKIVEAKRATYKTETATVESTEQTLDNSKINKAGFKNGFSDLEITLEAASKKYQAKSVASSLYYMSMSSKFKPSEWSAMLGRISDINREKYEKLTGRKAGESSNFSNSDIVELEKGFVDSFYSILWFVMKAVDGNSLITEMCNKYEVLAKACANDEESIKYISINKEPMSSLMDEVTFTIIVSEYTNNGKLVGNEYRYLNHTLSESAKSAGEDKTGKGYIKAAYNILLNTFNRL
jgi:hypothetical protein